MKLKKLRIPTLVFFLASCTSVDSDADFINIDLAGDINVEFVKCYERHQPDSLNLDDPYFSECLTEKLGPTALSAITNQIKNTLNSNEWILSKTIEDTHIFKKIRSYDKCVFTIHLTEETGEWSADYLSEKSNNPIFGTPTSTLIITRFTKPYCT